MIAVPELRTVFITPPRTASSSMREHLAEHCPESVVISYHGEADAIPKCFADYTVIGIVRDPIERLSSLYNFINNADPKRFIEGYIEPLKQQAGNMCFTDWLLYANSVFTRPLVGNKYYPRYNVSNIIPEQDKTFKMYFGETQNFIKHNEISHYLVDQGLPELPVKNSSDAPAQNFLEVLEILKQKHEERPCFELNTYLKRYTACFEFFKDLK
jgi:hypothetical protein